MSWLNNTQASIIVTINDEDFTQEFTNGQITDGSAINTGAVLTGGTLDFAELPGQQRLEDYEKSKFSRGTLVKIDVVIAGETKRHPRGWLYVIDSTYNMESRALALDVGCILTMHNITDDIGDLFSWTEFPLPGEDPDDEEVATFSDLLQAIASEGKFIYQKSDGTIEKLGFFDGDGLGSFKAPAAWVSVRDFTALAAQPLSNGSPVPDTVKISYSWEVSSGDDGGETDPITGKAQETDYTESTYFLEHPANIKKLQKVCTTYPDGSRVCKEVALNDAKKQFSVDKTEQSKRIYAGPGGSVSTEKNLTYGPAVEMAGGYYGELYAFELARANGNNNAVTLKGLNEILQTSSERTYEYGTGGEVVKQVERQFKNYLGAMTPNDWRAGSAEGTTYDPEDPPANALRGFLTSPPLTEMYLDRMQTTTFTYYDDRTVEYTETLTCSAACNGVGIYPPVGARVLQNIDADNNGVKTTVKRTSMAGLLNPDQPGRNPGGNIVSTKSAVYVDESSKYYPTSAGSIVLTSNVPYTVPGQSEADARRMAANYARITRAQLEGDAAGVRIAESMRPEIFGYVPGMPFSYYDRTYSTTLKLRMNSTGWAMAPGESIFSTEGCLIGRSNGTVEIPSNIDAVQLGEIFKEVDEQQKVVADLTDELDALSEDCDKKQALMAAIDAEIAGRP